MRLRLGFLALALAAVWCFVVALASGVEAFDGRRPGFSVELGAGVGVIPAEKRYFDDSFQSRVAFRSKASAVTRLRVGWGLGHHVLVQALDDVWWTTADFDEYFDEYEDELLLTHNVGLGLTYFFRPDARSLLAEVGLGAALARAPGANGNATGRGDGPSVWVGGGYAFSPWIARLTFGFDGAAEEFIYFGVEPEHDTLAVGLSLSRVWF